MFLIMFEKYQIYSTYLRLKSLKKKTMTGDNVSPLNLLLIDKNKICGYVLLIYYYKRLKIKPFSSLKLPPYVEERFDQSKIKSIDINQNDPNKSYNFIRLACQYYNTS